MLLDVSAVAVVPALTLLFFFFNDAAPPETSPLPLPAPLPIWRGGVAAVFRVGVPRLHPGAAAPAAEGPGIREGVPARIRRAAAVEAHGRAFRTGVGPADN